MEIHRAQPSGELTEAQTDRAAGVLLTQAVGDALGVPYEFATPPAGEPEMVGGGPGPYAPGEWSDDTQMAICIARVTATGADLTSPAALDAVAAAFEGWRAGLDLIGSERREQWAAWIAEATGADPARLAPNGYTVTALQAAWAAISSTDDGGSEGGGSPHHLRRALTAAVHAGDDTDTIAAIAGGLLGARYGASAVPHEWRQLVHGWPGMRADDLVDLSVATARG